MDRKSVADVFNTSQSIAEHTFVDSNCCSNPPDTTNPLVLEAQLFDMSLLRLWRTGALDEEYLPVEDGEVDVSLMVVCMKA